MYAPDPFNVNDMDEIELFLKNNSFGSLIHSGGSEPTATHLPFLVERQNNTFTLEGHIALKNDQSQFIRKGKSVLITFMGPTGYISSSVYDHPNVPTYNYQVVHIYGTITPMTSEEMVVHLHKMVNKYEHSRCPSLEMKSIPNELLHEYYKEIIGFKIESYKIEAAFKLSQNRNQDDFEAIINDLSKDQKNSALIEVMRLNRKRD
jgi:transcriptional regulator